MRGLKYFKAFFGLKPNAIKATVVLSPIVYPKRFEQVMGKKGKHYKSLLSYLVTNFKSLTFIKTPMLQSAVSDAVVLLRKTPCKKVIFVGAMGGLAKGLKVGDVFRTTQAKEIHSVGSIHEETRKKMLALRKRGVVGIDLESRAFFSAAKKAKLSAEAYYVVTDLPLTRPFFLGTTTREKDRISSSLRALVAKIYEDQAH